MNEGYQLKLKIKALDKTQEQAATALGMTRQNLALVFNKPKLDADFKQNVKDTLGIEFENQSNILNEDRELYINSKDELIQSLRETIASQNVTINLQAQLLEQLQSQVNVTAARKSA